jgi:hypothetical protein
MNTKALTSVTTANTKCVPLTANKCERPLARNATSSSGSKSLSPSTSARAIGTASGGNVAWMRART